MLLPLRLPLLLAASLAVFPALAQVGAPAAGAAAPSAATTAPGAVSTTPIPSITGTPQSQLGNTVGSTPAIGDSSAGSSIVGQTPSISPSTTPSTAPFSATTVPQSTSTTVPSTTVPSTTVPSTTVPSTTISPSTTRVCPNGMTVC